MIKNANELNLSYVAEQRYKSFDQAWRGILPDSWLNGFSVESVKKNTVENLKQGHRIYLYISDDGKEPCGYIMFGKYRGEELFCGEIMSIYFYEKFRGKGSAQELFDFAQNELIRDYKKIYIWVLEINGRARRFYEKNGYKIVAKGESKIAIGNIAICYISKYLIKKATLQSVTNLLFYFLVNL